MEENKNNAVIVNAPEGVTVDVIVGGQEEAEPAPEAAVVAEEAPKEEAIPESAPAEEEAPTPKKVENIPSTPDELDARIKELQENTEALLKEIEETEKQIRELRGKMPEALYQELLAAVAAMNESSVTIGKSEGDVMAEFSERVASVNRLYGELDYELAALKSSGKEDR